MNIHCKYDQLVDPKSLRDHPKNRNKHGQDQVERLASLYATNGIRHPIIVSRQTNCIVAGHGRKLAAILAGVEKMPVVYQNFETPEKEYAFIQSDNAIALWAELDLLMIKSDIQGFGPDFDISTLGIKNFTTESFEPFDPSKEWVGMPEFDQEDLSSFKKVIVHFRNEEDFNEFFRLLKQPHTDTTKSIWYPELERRNTEAKRY